MTDPSVPVVTDEMIEAYVWAFEEPAGFAYVDRVRVGLTAALEHYLRARVEAVSAPDDGTEPAAVNVVLTFADQENREWLAAAVMTPLQLSGASNVCPVEQMPDRAFALTGFRVVTEAVRARAEQEADRG